MHPRENVRKEESGKKVDAYGMWLDSGWEKKKKDEKGRKKSNRCTE